MNHEKINTQTEWWRINAGFVPSRQKMTGLETKPKYETRSAILPGWSEDGLVIMNNSRMSDGIKKCRPQMKRQYKELHWNNVVKDQQLTGITGQTCIWTWIDE